MTTPKEKELEKLLQQANDNPGLRPAFYQALLKAKVYVLGEITAELGRGGKAISLHAWQKEDGTPIFPIFSTLERLAQAAEGEPYMHLGVKEVFQAKPDAWFALNPHSEIGKEFTPEEVQALLDGSLYNQTEQIDIPIGNEILIGQPEIYPGELITALHSLFRTLPGVHKAYIAEIQKNAEERPHLIVGVENSGSFKKIAERVALVSRDYLKQDELLDIIQVFPEKGGIHAYFLSTMPIYVYGD